MIIIRFFTDFCSSTEVIKNYMNVYDLNTKTYNNLKFVDDETYTHAILINTAMPDLKIPKSNVFGFAHEPLALLYPTFVQKNFFEYAKKHIQNYYIGLWYITGNHIPRNIFKEHYGFQWHSWKKDIVPIVKDRKHIMSLILSDKQYLPGHEYRHKLTRELLKHNIDIHIWGGGAHNFKDPRAKGTFKEHEPYDDYYFTIAIENSPSNCYITEKFVNPLVRGCIPIYIGALKIRNIFNNNFYKLLNGNLQEDVKRILDIYKNYKNYLVNDFTEIQNEIFNGKAAFFPFLEQILTN